MGLTTVPLIIPASLKQTASIIFLHGLGDTGHGLSEIFKQLKPAYAKLICPTANLKRVTLYDAIIPSWFDLRPLDQPKDENGILMARSQIEGLIQEEVNFGIPESRIVLGGFSQGGALALFSGLFGRYQLGGILALSTWLPMDKTVNWKSIKTPRVLQCHGDEDNLVDISRATRTAKKLEVHLPKYKFEVYPGLDHSLNSAKELADIKQFFQDVIPFNEPSKL